MTAPAKNPAYFGRVWNVQIDTVQTSVLRVAFQVSKSYTSEPNRCALSVFNLAQSTRNQLRKQNVTINIAAGYQGVSSQIFSGGVRAIEHLRDNTEWITRVTGGDGEIPIRQNRISRSWGKNIPIATVLLDLANAVCVAPASNPQLAIGLGNVSTVASSNNFRKGVTKFTRGYTAHGSAYDSLKTLSTAIGYELSVQDQQLKLIPINNADVADTLLLSASSGLIGSPQVAERFLLKATSLMNGGYYPGRKVQLQSTQYNGLYRVMGVTHKGDSHGPDWFSELTLLGLSNPLPGHPP